MLQQSPPVPAATFAGRFRTDAGRRALGIGLALIIEALLLLLLLSLGAEKPSGREKAITVVNLGIDEVPEETPRPQSPERAEPVEEQAPQQQPDRQEPPPREPAEPPPPGPAEPLPQPPARPIPTPAAPVIAPAPPEQRPTAVSPNPVRPAPSGRPLYGPPNKGGSSSSGDTERVGTAPNGEPLYAAAWYREPRDDEMRGYLSTASGPGWGLIACRTAPNYRVEDCVALDEYPEGVRINRAALAAAWVFQVQPPRLGGRSLVGSWVRIRIDYGIKRR